MSFFLLSFVSGIKHVNVDKNDWFVIKINSTPQDQGSNTVIGIGHFLSNYFYSQGLN